MTAALYARVSTSDQNCRLQLDELRRYAAARGWEVAGEYVDTGWSGAKASRPELDRLMQDARERRFDAVLVWKLDRWGRSVTHALASINELTEVGIRWIAVTQGLDTDKANPTSHLLLVIVAAVAEFERELARERVKAGLASARSRGKALGRPQRVYDREKALRMRQRGSSVREIAAALGIGAGTVARLCRRNEEQKWDCVLPFTAVPQTPSCPPISDN